MKVCPNCQTRYDEEILRFCTKDGTPLVEEETPHFTELPSESGGDDFGEETVIRRKPSVPIPPPAEAFEDKRDSAPRIVIPTTPDEPLPQIRTKTTASVRREPLTQKSKTGKTILFTLLGTMAILASAAGIYWLIRGQNSGDASKNANANFSSIDTNLNTNLNVDNSLGNYNFNANVDANSSANAKTNANVKTPTPTPKPSVSPTPAANENVNSNNSNLETPSPSPRPTVSTTPTAPPSATPRPTPETPANDSPVNAGILNGRALSLPKPAYPSAARLMHASGQVAVQVLVDEGGNVLSAKATSGHPTLRAASENAARQSRFNPVKVGDRNVKAIGTVVYNFIAQ